MVVGKSPTTTNAAERPAGPAIGSVIKTVDGIASDGTPRSISLADGAHRTILFVYSPTCPSCKRSWPLFERLSARSRNQFNFAALCAGKASDVFETQLSSIGNPTRATADALRLATVPQTIPRTAGP